MKYTILISVFMLTGYFAQAQKYPTGKGTFRTGGGMNFSQVVEENETLYKFTLTPTVGYFIWDDVLGGLDLNYGGVAGYKTFTSTVKLSPEMRYYFKMSRSAFLLADGFYTLDKTTDFVRGTKTVDDNSSFSFGPGFDYFFTKRLGVETLLIYTYYLHPDATHVSRLGLSFGFNIHLPAYKAKPANNTQKKNTNG